MKEAYEILCEKQNANHMSPSSFNHNVESEAYLHWENISVLEEAYLRQKSKLHWLKIGYGNNKTCHRVIRTREVRME